MDDRDEQTASGMPEGIAVILAQRETWAEPPAELEDAVRAALFGAGGTVAANQRGNATSLGSSAMATEATDVTAEAAEDELSAARRRRTRRGSADGRWPNGRLLLVAAAIVGVAAVGSAIAISQTGPDATIVALTATELEPEASGTAAISETPSGFSIELDIEGLPPAPEGSYYQGWLKNADGDLVTIGTFHVRDGSDNVILWSGVDPAVYSTLTVTLQREGEGAQSSGQVVLIGNLG